MSADPITIRTVDDLMANDINFDSDDDPFADPKSARQLEHEERDDKPTLSPRKRKAADDDAFGNDINEEIKIKKQRVKIPKLDADRLCSQPGIPKIRELLRSGKFKKTLRLKGKGHELSDAARLLNYYQIWLDNLYPRAKFADALQLVERAGHNKKLQVMRKAWIDEGKPGYVRREDLDKAMDVQEEDRLGAESRAQDCDTHPRTVEEHDNPGSLFFGNDNTEDHAADANGPDDDELDALLAQDNNKPTIGQENQVLHVDSEGEDDLDALLAEQDTLRKQPRPVENDEVEDDLDALMNEQDSSNEQQQKNTKSTNSKDPKVLSMASDEEDDLDALLNENTLTKAPAESQPAPIAAEFDEDFDDEDLDDLDVLLSNNTSAKKVAEPELPQLNPVAMSKTSAAAKPVTSTTPGSEEVPELDNVISSSPVPNVRTDELDELMDEHDAKVHQKQVQTPRKKTNDDTQLIEQFMSSSPIPNEESQ
ncbi:chromosome segregation in meiosis- protein [Neophaeococcomyces mojaviensis]|uniref:Chromosome segregation in meiosis- protein n=1 Tax=Neophaeococcomyces mojaviensis TaxID=3383035 RepID=A0ACC3A3Q9_9EURO|nr:chromosome segregation in meiosis- protein [Knufia sp. JES_112]